MNAPRSGCPISLTLEALGDRWSLIVIRDLTFGKRRHFRELLTRSEERRAPCWPTWAVGACVTQPRRKSCPYARKPKRAL
jgi:hypothetical protein